MGTTDIVPARQVDRVPPPPLKDEALAPAALLRRLRRQWPLLLTCGFVFGTVGYVGSVKLLPKQYTSSGLVAVDTRAFAIPELAGALNTSTLPEPRPLVDSEVLVLRSPDLIKALVDELDLKADPEYNPTLRPPGFFDALKAKLRDTLPESVRQQGITL